jgi:hypothetical protein
MLALAVILLAFSACGAERPEPTPPEEAIEIGVGEVTFRFEVVDDENYLTIWYVSTDEQTIGGALSAVGLIEGDESAFGLMVTSVNGLHADGAWWAFYIDGEMSMTGVSETYVEAGRTYAFKFTSV